MPVQKWQLGAGAGVLVLAVAGGVGYTVLNKPAPAPAPAPVVAAAPAAAPAPAPVNLAPTDNDPVAEFAATTDAAVVTTATAAYLAPNLNAPQFYPLKVGTPIQGSEKSTDGKWLLALTADGQAAFIPMSALGPYDPSAPAPATATASPGSNAAANQPAALPSATVNAIDALSGKAKVVDTATLMVGVQQVSLAGISGEGGDAARQLQDLIDSKGGNVDCKRQAGKYVCSENGIGDIARAVLYNGSARPAADASDDYRKQADDAKAARRGVWAKS